jgi:4-amino-4-deoxy-L-arabinose transferase-like glycosyltransferase
MTILVTYRLVQDRIAALIAGGFMALDLPSIAISNTLLTETVFTFLIVTAIFSLILYLRRDDDNSWYLLASALFLGLAILCRPIAVLLPLFLIPCFFLFHKHKVYRSDGSGIPHKSFLFSLKRTLFFICVIFLVLSPWLIRNQLVFGTPFISSIGYYNLLYWRAAGVIAVKKNVPRPAVKDSLMLQVQTDFPGDAQKDPITLRKYEGKKGITIILQDVPTYIRNHTISVCNMLFRPIRSTLDLQLGYDKNGTKMTEWGEDYRGSILVRFFAITSPVTVMIVAIQLPLLLLLWLSFWVGIKTLLSQKKRPAAYLILSLTLYFCIMSGGPEAWARFRVPILPFVAIAAAVGLQQFTRVFKGDSA